MTDETPPAEQPPTPPRRAKSRALRWALGLATAILAYAAIGFLALPALIRHQLPKFADKELHRKASIGEVSINPFTLRVELHDFKLTEADGRPIAGFGLLLADLEWSSITRRAWHLAELRLADPSALLDIAPDGKINLAELVNDLTRDSKKEEKSALPRLVIDRLAIEHGHADFADRRAGYKNALAPFDFHIEHLSTLPEDRGPYTFSAGTADGGSLRWKGELSLNPIAATGTVTGEALSLPELSAYLKPYVAAGIESGKAAFSLPYRVAYRDGRLEASIDDASFGIDQLALKAEGASAAFLQLKTLKVGKVSADYAKHSAEIGEVTLDTGKVEAKRDARGAIDLAGLVKAQPAAAASAQTPAPPADTWKLKLGRLNLDNLAVALEDRTAAKPLTATIARVSLQAGAEAEFGKENRIAIGELGIGLHDLALVSAGKPALKLGTVELAGGRVDLAAHTAHVDRIALRDAQAALHRDRQGKIDLLDLVPGPGSAAPAAKTPAGTPWQAAIDAVALEHLNLELADEGTGIALHVVDLGAKLAAVSSDLTKPVKFSAGFTLKEGGKFAFDGSAVPARAAVDTKIAIDALSLKPVQPLLSRYVKLKLASGSVSVKGEASLNPTAPKAPKTPQVRFNGGFSVDKFRLDEAGGPLFASWDKFGADKLTLTLGPDRLEIPELRIAGADARLMIEADHSLNASRLLVEQPKDAAKKAAPATSATPFPVLVRRLRVQDAKLEFSDQSLRPQFAAKIHELGGVINGLSTDKATRSQIELDGRVDEYGQARIRGELNPFAPFGNTDVALSFKNVDVTSASPYAMKFAGYKIASGKMSLDVKYAFRDRKLEGTNKVVFNKLTLGERVESPDALHLPLELALAILTDSEGKIDLDLPVSGDLDDPKFSYGAIVWKAIANVITKIVTAPFRALGALFGVSADKLQSIDFDPGRASLLPAEREKLKQVAGVLAKRAQLALSVPGSYNAAVDGLALRTRATRLEIARRAGIAIATGEEPGPLDLQDTAVRKSLRALLTERDGEAAWTARKEAAVKAAAGSPGPGVLERAKQIARGEPQVADLGPFYRGIEQHLIETERLAPDALQGLARARSAAILDSLKAGGVEAARLKAAAPVSADAAPGQPVAVKLELSAR